MANLSTRYMGLKLKNPLVASAGPLTRDAAAVAALEDAGAGAIVLHSLFEEQIGMEGEELRFALERSSESYGESLGYFPDCSDYNIGPDRYLALIARAKERTSVPIVASLNGCTPGGWTKHAALIQEAGADALELNEYIVASNPDETAEEVERRYVDLVREVRSRTTLPLAVKIGPYFSAMANMARKLAEAGADALVLFNRFYQPDFDLDEMAVAPNLILSSPDELRLRLRWTAILSGRVKADIAVTGGVHGAKDALKAIAAGAAVAMTTSSLLANGIDRLGTILDGMDRWLHEKEYESTDQLRGALAQRGSGDPDAFERSNYLKTLGSYAAMNHPR